MSYINRAIEPLLIKKYQSYKSVAVTGARQVGKTRMTKELFPNVVTEGKIDFDMLRFLLGDEVEDAKEKYQFTWNGKADSIKLAQSPSAATLRPCKEKSKNWSVR